jgi:hypothetical protein
MGGLLPVVALPVSVVEASIVGLSSPSMNESPLGATLDCNPDIDEPVKEYSREYYVHIPTWLLEPIALNFKALLNTTANDKRHHSYITQYVS